MGNNEPYSEQGGPKSEASEGNPSEEVTSGEEEEPHREGPGRRERRGSLRKRTETSGESEGEQLTCDVCGKSVRDKRGRRDYKKKVHSRARSPCPRCRRVCSTANNEKRHNVRCRAAQTQAPPNVPQEDPQTEATGEMQEEEPAQRPGDPPGWRSQASVAHVPLRAAGGPKCSPCVRAAL